MRCRFIINPIAGGKSRDNIEDVINQNINKKKFDYDIFFTTHSSHAKELTIKAVNEKVDLVIAVGGDGTVNECASQLINSKTSLSIIPTGSGNGLAYHLGINNKLAKSIQQLNQSKFKLIDTCTANGIPFFNIAGVGFDAHIANLFSSTKRGFINYVKLIIKELNYKARKYKMTYNGKNIERKSFLIAFANGSQYGNNFKISPLSIEDDGLIDFCVIKDFSKWKIPLFCIKIARGKTHLSKNVEIIKTKRMIIESNEEMIHLDGEPVRIGNKIDIQVIPKSLKIFLPNV